MNMIKKDKERKEKYKESILEEVKIESMKKPRNPRKIKQQRMKWLWQPDKSLMNWEIAG